MQGGRMFVVMIFVVDIDIDETGTGWLEHSSSLLSSSTGIAGLTQGLLTLKYLLIKFIIF